jgi:cysteine desulfurase/selenocysteine lyase
LIHGHRLIYLDNASTTQKPQSVIDAMTTYYEHSNANIHRGVYQLSEEATTAYEGVRQKVADFIHANSSEIIFTKGTTESLNLLAYSLGKSLQKGDEVVLTHMEHHSSLVPWQQIAHEKGALVRFIPLRDDGRLDMTVAKRLITANTKFVIVTHVSNVLGTINPIKALSVLAHAVGAKIIIDGAQAVAHFQVDMKELDCDFYAFSAHKMYGPTGVGVLYGKKELLETLPPFLYGGSMIREVTLDKTTWNDVPWKFEAGTPNIAGVIGLGAAVEYLQNKEWSMIQHQEQELTAYALEQLRALKPVKIYGPLTTEERGGVISFTLQGVHSHDIATLFDQRGIAVRGGHHCAMPLMKLLKTAGTTRLSFGIYNTKEDVDAVVDAIRYVIEVFHQ